ncbi:uncharacterized protein LOC143454916 [Clavelina lepadiformis]|uniref:uncharacterized protein LOC143454916 n=1 Tax=Clavelina lepadiformis TaxID=159417 RepID=UPI0040434E26
MSSLRDVSTWSKIDVKSQITSGFPNDTDLLQFLSKLQNLSPMQRPKWIAFDKKRKEKIILEKVSELDSNYINGNFGFKNKKFPKPKFESILSRDLFREALLHRCARKCPFVLTCWGFVVDSLQNVYILTEHFDGQPLEKRVTYDNARHIAFQILKALEFLHSANIVHNDIRRENVLIRHGGNDANRLCGALQIKLFNFQKARDFGIAVDRKDSYTCQKCHVVTEQCLPSYDMLCFGFLLFEILQGGKPWKTSCSCDKAYMNYCQRFVKLAQKEKISLKFAIEQNVVNKSNEPKSTDDYTLEKLRFSFTHNCRKSRKGIPACQPDKRWRQFSSRFSKCLLFLLSPIPECRPSCFDLLRGQTFSCYLFTNTDKQGAWQRKRFLKNLAVANCSSVQ